MVIFAPKKWGIFGLWCCVLLLAICARVCSPVRSDKETRERFYGNMPNSTAPESNDGTIAKMFDRVLEKEFSENEQPEGNDKSSFNSSVADQQAVLETVAKITHDKAKKNDTHEGNATRPFQLQDVFSLENEDSEDVTTLIDKKDNVFVMSNKKSKYPVLQVDLRLISDLVVLIVSAAIGGIIFSCLGQPVIVGYLLAGSLIGPGGLKFISEMVQTRTATQLGEADDDNAEADDGDAELRNVQNTTNGDGRCTTNDDERDRCEASGENAKLWRRWRCGGDEREIRGCWVRVQFWTFGQ
ncbi:K(+) efflux antiporter 5 [Stylosanthes scabra]|uniref:K(+) efflux antiporter 5 n=1 Tax=Stylosanthes scabra TaxID=79078 RepID=A0ABU6Z295_9FABA|nr:K(+) efflux antiporter 5 [Stylosanthes scabra]